nr:methylenetetrahydrofolate--tRNA-(uracil(54)-C(5))-methyltransferase (FADH(2)-oxidizing) TrmFO [bacterium]
MSSRIPGEVHVIGAGLAGSEAAWQLAVRGVHVVLHEMRPGEASPAHHSGQMAELVCSNSFKSTDITSAQGLLKEELRRLGSLIMACADQTSVPAGAALAVDREAFSGLVTGAINAHPNIRVEHERVDTLPEGPCIVATGPLTDGALAEEIASLVGQPLHFFDAAAPVVYADSLAEGAFFSASRHGKGDDYLNCPLDREQYLAFWQALCTAEEAPVHGFEDKAVFEGCVPVEVLARRGEDTLRFGPMKPVGLINPATGRMPYAVLQLRREDRAGILYNLVGFQTHLKMPEQRRVFGMIPALAGARYARYGVMHRNSFLPSPDHLDACYRLKARPNIWFAGQMTGVEGYLACAASGFVCGRAAAGMVMGKPMPDYTDQTVIGALGHYVSGYAGGNFQPMGPSHGLLAPLNQRAGKRDRGLLYANRSLNHIDFMADACAGEAAVAIEGLMHQR